MLLLPLRFKIELHLYLSNISIRPTSDWADNQSKGVANKITGVAPLATPWTCPCVQASKTEIIPSNSAVLLHCLFHVLETAQFSVRFSCKLRYFMFPAWIQTTHHLNLQALFSHVTSCIVVISVRSVKLWVSLNYAHWKIVNELKGTRPTYISTGYRATATYWHPPIIK